MKLQKILQKKRKLKIKSRKLPVLTKAAGSFFIPQTEFKAENKYKYLY